MATVLEIIQDAAAEIGIPVGASIAATDKTMVRMVALLNRTGKNLRRQAAWPECLKRYTFDLVEDQTRYPFPADWDAWANETIWNEDDSDFLVGPLTPSQYEYYKNGVSVSDADQKYRAIGITRGIEILPAPTSSDADQTVVYEFFSQNWLRPTDEWTDDTVYSAGEYVYYGDNIYVTAAGGTSGYAANPSNTVWTEGETVGIGGIAVDRYYGNNLYRSQLYTGVTGDTPPTHTSGVVSDGGVLWEYRSSAMPTHMEGTATDGNVIWAYSSYETLNLDSDVVLLDPELLTLGLIYRWLDGKSLQGQKAEAEYHSVLRDRIGQVLGGSTINMTGRGYNHWASKEDNMPRDIEV